MLNSASDVNTQNSQTSRSVTRFNTKTSTVTCEYTMYLNHSNALRGVCYSYGDEVEFNQAESTRTKITEKWKWLSHFRASGAITTWLSKRSSQLILISMRTGFHWLYLGHATNNSCLHLQGLSESHHRNFWAVNSHWQAGSEKKSMANVLRTNYIISTD